MKKLALLALLASAAAMPSVASAQVAHPGMRSLPGAGMRAMQHRLPRVLQRGFVLPSFWFGPQFQISNWQVYGLRSPPRQHRWVRYYDGAYLVDQRGRVVDRRDGLDWDRYGGWDMDDGIPVYRDHDRYADRDYDRRDHDRYADRDYDRRDSRYRDDRRGGYDDCDCEEYGAGGGHGRADVRVFRQPVPAPGMVYGHGGPGPYGPPPGYGAGAYGAYGGYGYGYGGGAIIVETTTTVHADQESYATEIVEEEYVQQVRRRPVRRAAPRPRPRPPAGERG